MCRIERIQPRIARDHFDVGYHVATAGEVSVTLHDVTGRLVHTLRQGLEEAGIHTAIWSYTQRPLPSGVYFLRLETPAATDGRRLTLVR